MEDSGAETVRITCGELLQISKIRDLHAVLTRALESAPGAEIELDASAADNVDASALQLMCAFIRDSTSSGRTIHWLRPTEALLEAAQLLQLDSRLALSRPGFSGDERPAPHGREEAPDGSDVPIDAPTRLDAHPDDQSCQLT